MPIAFTRWRHISVDRILKMPMMTPTTPRKTELCCSIFSVSMNYRTCVRQLQSIVRWQRQNSVDVFRNFPKITVVIGEKDDTLDNQSMKTSAESGRAKNTGVSILETAGTNHFISLERPEILLRWCNRESTAAKTARATLLRELQLETAPLQLDR